MLASRLTAMSTCTISINLSQGREYNLGQIILPLLGRHDGVDLTELLWGTLKTAFHGPGAVRHAQNSKRGYTRGLRPIRMQISNFVAVAASRLVR